MICPNCAKLAILNTKKKCIRCQGEVLISIGILCETCSNTEKKCSICVKNIITPNERKVKRGCNCGRK